MGNDPDTPMTLSLCDRFSVLQSRMGRLEENCSSVIEKPDGVFIGMLQTVIVTYLKAMLVLNGRCNIGNVGKLRSTMRCLLSLNQGTLTPCGRWMAIAAA